MKMRLNREQLDILDHTMHRTANGLFCGSSPDMQELVRAGFMVEAGFKSFVPDPYFKITGKGIEAFKNAKEEATP
jgi:hypothetical protein